MGCKPSKLHDEVVEAKAVNDAIDTQIKHDRENRKNVVQMLLLGAGESGKSTILKQLKILHQGGFNDEERTTYKEIIFSNTIQSVKAILHAMPRLCVQLHPDNEVHRKFMMQLPTQIVSPTLPKEIYDAISALKEDPGFKEVLDRNNEYQLNDSAPYYFDEIKRMSTRGYIPSDQDILRSRVKTSGITEASFFISPLTYKFFDVGGQRSERRKWIHCFENLDAVIFVVALSEYDQVLREDSNVSRMAESVYLFNSICNSRWFTGVSMILFLNKMDLLADKIASKPLKSYIRDYKGPEGYEAACTHFRKVFAGENRSPNRAVYTHFTCATETKQIKFVMTAMHDIIAQGNLAKLGLL